MWILSPCRAYLLDFVLGVRFPAATLHLSRVQETVFPYGVGPVTGQGLNHLKHKRVHTHTHTQKWLSDGLLSWACFIKVSVKQCVWSLSHGRKMCYPLAKLTVNHRKLGFNILKKEKAIFSAWRRCLLKMLRLCAQSWEGSFLWR